MVSGLKNFTDPVSLLRFLDPLDLVVKKNFDPMSDFFLAAPP